MSRGRRYEEPKLNMKKVFAVIIAIAVLIMFIFIIKGILEKDKEQVKISSKDYVSVFKDNKWGVIDSNAQMVIDPSYSEMIIIPDSKSDVFLCVYDVNYETGEYKTKVLNSKNQEIFTGYDKVEAIQNYDENNNLWYEAEVLKVKKGDMYGIINLTGKELTEIKYEEISAIPGIKSALQVKENDKFGVIDGEGKTIVENKYAGVTNLGKDNKSGFIVKGEDGKYGIVDYSNKIVLDTKYDEVLKIYGNDMYVVKQSGNQILVKKDGTELLNKGFDSVHKILKSEENGIIFIKDSKFGIMKTNGEVTIDPEYEDMKEAKSGVFIASKDGKYGVIDLQKNTKIEFKYAMINYNEKADIYIAEDTDFRNDIIDNSFEVKISGILLDMNDDKGYIKIRQNDEYKYYNYKFEEKKEAEININNTLFLSRNNGKYGFVDKQGNVVVDYIYDDATEQNVYGYAGIKKDGKWGSIDNKGNVVQEPTYNLDNYLKVDFVGRWHFGKDINMNYYNQL